MAARKRIVSTRVDEREAAIIDAATLVAGQAYRGDWMRRVLVAGALEVLRQTGTGQPAGGGE